MNCLIARCENKFGEGGGQRFLKIEIAGTLSDAFICHPCWYTMIDPTHHTRHSQLYRNLIECKCRIRNDTGFILHDDSCPYFPKVKTGGQG